MTLRSVSFLQGVDTARYLLPAEDHRLNHAGLWLPDGNAGGLRVRSGIVAGPGNPGAVAVATGGLNVNPFHAVIQGTINGVQGAYEVTSDAVEFRGVTAASSTEYRRGRLVARVYDRLQTDAVDQWLIEVVYGAAAGTAGAAALPALPPNALNLRSFLVNPDGTIVLEGEPPPAVVSRGGVQPVIATDTVAGSYLGQYRDHPTLGLQRWNGSAWQSMTGGSDAGYQVATGASISLANGTNLRLPLTNVQSSTPDVTAATDGASWTLNRAGVWLLACGYRVAPIGTGGNRYAVTIANGDVSVAYRQTDSVNVANQPFDIAISAPIRFPAGQTISAVAFTNGGASAIDTAAGAAARTFFTAVFLRA